MSGSLPTARCSLPFDMGVIMVHLHLWEEAGCFNLMLAKKVFSQGTYAEQCLLI